MTALVNPKLSECQSCFENDVLAYSGHGIIHRDAILIFAEIVFLGEVWSSLREEPHEI